MKNKIRRSIVAVCALAAVCAPLGTSPVFTDISSSIITASAEDTTPYTSGATNRRYFYLENSDAGYTLWFSIRDQNAKTAVVTGCTTTKELVDVNIPDTATAQYNGETYTIVAIGDNAFRDQTRLHSVKMQKNVAEIAGFAFAGCSELAYVDASPIKERGSDYLLSKIGYNAFMDCVKLTTPNYMNSVTRIGEYAYYNCDSLNMLILPKLSSMGQYAFSCCDSLIYVDMSNAPITYIPPYAFQYSCPDRNTECTVKLPATAQTIGRYSFNNVNGLRKIDISNATNIGEGAFMDCHKLKSAITSERLSYVADKAFFGCDPMKYFVCKNENVFIGSKAIGYDDLRNYQGVKQNFTLWGVSDNSSAKRYAASQSTPLPFKLISDAASLASERYIDYEWSAVNYIWKWSDHGNYYFNSAHQPYAGSKLGEPFGGICSGMAAVSALTSSGYLSVSDYAPGFTRLRDVHIDYSIPKDTRSYVTTVFANFANAPGSGFDYMTVFDSSVTDTQEVFSKEMLNYAEDITYGADAAVFVVEPKTRNAVTGEPDPGHALVCFGMERRENAADKNASRWNSWDARLLIYNPNSTIHDAEDYVYVNLSNGTWSSTLASKYGNGTSNTHFKMVHSYNKMVSPYNGMTADEFFAAIRN